MCGIITSLTKKPSLRNTQRVKLQYEKQDHRGTDGFGFVAVENGEIIHARSTEEAAILAELDKLGPTTFIMFHHRIPTCNLNAVKANHPFFIASKKNLTYKYYVCHNGSISNTDSLRKEHEEEGFKYKTIVEWRYGKSEASKSDQTDSESLGIEMAKFIENRQSRIKARGLVATFILQTDRDNKPVAFYYFKEGKPIKFYANGEGAMFASEGMGVDAEDKILYRLDLTTGELTSKEAKLTGFDEIGKKDDGEITEFKPVVKKKKTAPFMLHSGVTHNVRIPDRVIAVQNIVNNTSVVVPRQFNTGRFATEFSIDSIRKILSSEENKLYNVESDIYEFCDKFGEEIETEEIVNLRAKRKVLGDVVQNLRDRVAAYHLLS